jgi:hypothetical protein
MAHISNMNLIIQYTRAEFTAEYIANALSEYANISKITLIPAYHLSLGSQLRINTVYITIDSWKETNIALAALDGLSGESNRFTVRHNNIVADDFIVRLNTYNDGNISGLGKTTYFNSLQNLINDCDTHFNKEDIYPKHPNTEETDSIVYPKNIPVREIAKDYVMR